MTRFLYQPIVLLVAAVILTAVVIFLPGPAGAATITVNTFTDELNADGDCSLREAVRAANTDLAVDACTAGSGADTINLQTGNYALMIAGASEDAAATGDLDLLGTVTIAGTGATTVKTIPATGDRVFHVIGGATATISGVTVEGGASTSGGGIVNNGTLTLTDGVVHLNNASFGGGVFNTGTLTLTNISVINNNAGEGAGLYNGGTSMTLNNVTLSGNQATTGNADGGAIYSTGGSVTLTDTSVDDNNASSEGGGAYILGGAFTMDNSTVTGNDASYGGGIYKQGAAALNIISGSAVTGNGASTQGGGIYILAGSATVTDSEVSTNNATFGGGIYSAGGVVVLTNSTVSGNAASSSGGGAYAGGGTFTINTSTVTGNGASYGAGVTSEVALTLESSTVSNNSANIAGGGLNLGFATQTIKSSTISGNIATSDGGGAYVASGTVALNNSTISGNAAGGGGGGMWAQNGNVTLISATVTSNNSFTGASGLGEAAARYNVKNTIIANNFGSPNCSAAIGDYGYNLSSDASCVFYSSTSLEYTYPRLGPLADNGGPTRTHALLDGSPAIDVGLPFIEPLCSGGDDFDQRGVARPQGLRCDIGAYEAIDSDADGVPDPLDDDDDDDTVPDSLDSCPLVPEDDDAWDDGDGCPESDNDQDGICDAGQTSVSCTGSDVGRYVWQAPLGATTDCRNVAEDFDAFHDSDGCPEPDNDYDTFQDFTDDCPGADSNAGPDGISDTGDEPVLYLTPYQAREDFDGVIDWDGCHDSPNDDYDGDGLGDETEVFTLATDPVNPDTDADTVIDGSDNCPLWTNVAQTLPNWPLPAGDADCDGFPSKVAVGLLAPETYIGTNPTRQCAANSTANNESGADAWPMDFNDNRLANGQDFLTFIYSFAQPVNGPAITVPGMGTFEPERWDFTGNGIINGQDFLKYINFFAKSCSLTGS